MLIDKYIAGVRKEINFNYRGYDVLMTITVNGESCKMFKDGKLQDNSFSFSYFIPLQDRLDAMAQSIYTMLSIINTIDNTIKYNEDKDEYQD